MERDINRLRKWCIRRKLDSWKAAKICSYARIPRATFYVWWNKFQRYGWEGLEPKSRKPLTIHRTSIETVNEIIRLRRQHNWGPNKIEGYLKHHASGGIVSVGHNAIYRIICNAKLNNPIDNPRKMWGHTRFARSKPNELWQCDWKLTNDDEWMVTYLDDYSRFIVASEVYRYPRREYCIKLLRRCIEEHGKPVQLLTDRGTQFFSVRGGTSCFTQFCRNNGIEHIVASKRRPTTIGKVESWHRAYEYEKTVSHKEFVRYWNHERPHQGIGYLCPAELYFHKTV